MKSNIVCTTVCTSTACEFCSHWQYLHTFLPYTMYMALVCNLKSLQQIDSAASDYNSNSAAGCGRAPQRIHSTTTCSSVYQLLIASKISAVVPMSSIYHASNQEHRCISLCFTLVCTAHGAAVPVGRKVASGVCTYSKLGCVAHALVWPTGNAIWTWLQPCFTQCYSLNH